MINFDEDPEVGGDNEPEPVDIADWDAPAILDTLVDENGRTLLLDGDV